ncbi:hypothetical protein IV203_031079 [Nitzschia inconspicua]|uniref:Uncharacterized protein n=1 Tax=Nitzschia inconspicua TaxID=303405 RepID=A0A9K3Q2A7_9STRA|nr:hypothetical protein IV203_031079 [Nitzschia inconspicua]
MLPSITIANRLNVIANQNDKKSIFYRYQQSHITPQIILLLNSDRTPSSSRSFSPTCIIMSPRRQPPFVLAILLIGNGNGYHGVTGFSTQGNILSKILPMDLRRHSTMPVSFPLHALIYGWDDYEEDDKTTTKPKQPKPLAFDTSGNAIFAGGPSVCDAAGSSIADHLTNDRDQMGSLARLAFAFRPKEHSGLNMKDIETVHVLCVKPNEIEVEAILCESLGCVSLHIPIQFPSSCTHTDEDDKFQSCVLQNLKDLDVTATTQVSAHLTSQSQSSAINPEMLLSGTVQLPSWWVSPSSTLNAAALETECNMLKDILNEDEFQTELMALAQDGLKHSLHHQQNDAASTPTIQKARCSIVGPAGIGMKALARQPTDGSVVVMDVLFPFGGPSKQTADSLRAAVLGAVAVAAEQQL